MAAADPKAWKNKLYHLLDDIDRNYHFNHLKTELAKKENTEFQNLLGFIEIIQEDDVSKIRAMLPTLEKICDDEPNNYVALSLLAYANIKYTSGFYAKTTHLYERALAIKKDFIFANYMLGVLYGRFSMRLGVAPYRSDEAKALPLLLAAAEQGYAAAQYEYGHTMYGESVENSDIENIVYKDPKNMHEWVKKAALGGYPTAQYEYYHACGDDIKQQIECLQRVAELGHQMAQYRLAGCFYYGRGVKQDINRAISWYQVCIKNKFIDESHYLEIAATYQLAQIFEMPNCEHSNLALSKELYARVCELGSPTLASRWAGQWRDPQYTYVDGDISIAKVIKICERMKFVSEIIEQLLNNKTELELKIIEKNLTEVELIAVANALAVNTSLRSLGIFREKMLPNVCETFSEALKRNSSLNSFTLRNTSNDPAGFKHLCEGLIVNRTLTMLNLSGNDIDDGESATHIANLISRNKTLISLDISHADIGDQGASAIGEALSNNRRIRSLELRANPISRNIRLKIQSLIQRNQALYLEEQRMSLAFGLHSRVGAGSTILAASQDPLFDRRILKLCLAFTEFSDNPGYSSEPRDFPAGAITAALDQEDDCDDAGPGTACSVAAAARTDAGIAASMAPSTGTAASAAAGAGAAAPPLLVFSPLVYASALGPVAGPGMGLEPGIVAGLEAEPINDEDADEETQIAIALSIL